MDKKDLNEYRKQYNKDNYKTVKVYIPLDEYERVTEHMKTKGYNKVSGYIKHLIDTDIYGE